MPDSTTRAGLFSLPWRILIAPVRSWRQVPLHEFPWPAILASWTLSALGWLLTARQLSELGQVAGLGYSKSLQSGPGLLAVAVLLFPLSLAIISGLGLLAKLGLAILGHRLSFSTTAALAGYALLPASLGNFMGRVLFFFAQPLAEDARQAVALQLKPFTLGAAELLPGLFAPLSLQWFAATYLDLFGLWGLVLLILGLRHFLGLSRFSSVWAFSVLVLLLLLVLTGLWQAAQGIAAP
jgi:hypothetical protein